MEAHAAAHGRMVCEINSEPPNVESIAFHELAAIARSGISLQANGHETVMMEKPL